MLDLQMLISKIVETKYAELDPIVSESCCNERAASCSECIFNSADHAKYCLADEREAKQKQLKRKAASA